MADNIINIGAKADLSALKTGMQDASEVSKQAIGGIKTAFELLGVTISDSVAEWLATLPGVGAAFEAAFPVLAVSILAEKLGELIEQHRLVQKALQGEGADWDKLRESADQFSDNTKIKLLEIRQRVDELTEGSLAGLKDQIAIIDAQTLIRIKQQFKDLAAEGKKALADMDEGVLMSYFFGTHGAEAGIKDIRERFDNLMEYINAAQQKGDVKGIGKLIDQEIAETQRRIQNSQIGGTSQTKLIIQANEQLLTVLRTLKAEYTEINEVAAGEKRIVAIKQEQASAGKAPLSQAFEVQISELNELKAAAVASYTAMGDSLDEAKTKAEAVFGPQELQARLDFFDKQEAAATRLSDKQKIATDRQKFLNDEGAKSLNALAESQSKLNESVRRFNQELDKENKEIAGGLQKQLTDQAAEQSRLFRELIDLQRAETAEEAHRVALQQVHSLQRVNDISLEIRELQKLRDAAAAQGRDTLSFDAAIHQSEIRQLQDQQNLLLSTGRLGNAFKAVFKQIQIDAQQASQRMFDVMKQAIDGMNRNLAQFVVEGKANWTQLVATMIEGIAEIVLQQAEAWLVMKIMHKGAVQTEIGQAVASGLAKVEIDANVAAANAYAPLAAFPPAAAAAASAAYGAVHAFAAGIAAVGAVAHFEKGGIVPATGLALVHEGERILPRSLSGDGRGLGGGSPFVFAPTIHALDAQGVDRILTKHQRIFEARVDKVLRKKGFLAK